MIRYAIGCSVMMLGLACLTGAGLAQERQAVSPEQYVELLRSALRTERVALVTENMHMTQAQADKFWPIYRDYDNERTKLGDARIAIIKDYAKHYETMNDEKAEILADRALLNYEDRLRLRRAYFEKLSKAIGAVVAARFIQIDHQIDLLVDLEIASQMPLVAKPVPATR
jgi:hypothetical protein